jgi:hypothetical protein
LPTERILIDDKILVATLVGEQVPLDQDAPRYTTSYFYFRACRAFVSGGVGTLSGPLAELDLERKADVVESMLRLPPDIGLPDPRQLVAVMAHVNRRHPHLNVLNTEAAAAALLLGTDMLLSPPTASGQLQSVLAAEGISWTVVELP